MSKKIYKEPVNDLLFVPSLGCCCCGNPEANELNDNLAIMSCGPECAAGWLETESMRKDTYGCKLVKKDGSNILLVASPTIGFRLPHRETMEHKKERDRIKLLKLRTAALKREAELHAAEEKARRAAGRTAKVEPVKRPMDEAPTTLKSLPTPPGAVSTSSFVLSKVLGSIVSTSIPERISSDFVATVLSLPLEETQRVLLQEAHKALVQCENC